MQINSYGVVLRRLQQQDIEMLRQWRNDPRIQQHMFYRQTITPEMQQQWFKGLSPTTDYYFIIEYHGQPTGLIDITQIDWEAKCGMVGLFIYGDEYIATPVPVYASLALLDHFLGSGKLTELQAKVRPNNEAAIQYNRSLGFEIEPDSPHLLEPDNPEVPMLMKLTTERYLEYTKTLREKAVKVSTVNS